MTNKEIKSVLIKKNRLTIETPIYLWSNTYWNGEKVSDYIEETLSFFLKLILFKIPFFKNRNKESYIFLKSLLLTLIILPIFIALSYIFVYCVFVTDQSLYASISDAYDKSISFIKNNPKKISTMWLPIFSIIYWNLRNKFAGQWLYCAEIYNKITFDLIDTKNPREIFYYRVTLSLDLLQLNLYAHKSFYKTFNSALEKSIYYIYSFKPDVLNEINEKNFWWNSKKKCCYEKEIERFKSGKGSIAHAYFYLSKVQNVLDELLTEELSADLISGRI